MIELLDYDHFLSKFGYPGFSTVRVTEWIPYRLIFIEFFEHFQKTKSSQNIDFASFCLLLNFCWRSGRDSNPRPRA